MKINDIINTVTKTAYSMACFQIYKHLFLTFTAILAILHGQPMGKQIAERGALAKSIRFLPWVVVCGSDSRFEAELKDKFKSLETLGKVTGIEKWDIELATSPVTTQKNCQWLTQLKRNEFKSCLVRNHILNLRAFLSILILTHSPSPYCTANQRDYAWLSSLPQPQSQLGRWKSVGRSFSHSERAKSKATLDSDSALATASSRKALRAF